MKSRLAILGNVQGSGYLTITRAKGQGVDTVAGVFDPRRPNDRWQVSMLAAADFRGIIYEHGIPREGTCAVSVHSGSDGSCELTGSGKPTFTEQ